MAIDKTKIPETTNFIIENYLQPIFPRIPYESLVLSVLFSISEMLCYNRVTIENSELRTNSTYPNIYVMSFSRSGTGKDRGLREMKGIMEFFEQTSKKEFAEFIQDEKDKVEREIEKAGMKTAKANEYRKEKSPRWLKMNIDSNSTPEGFLEQRKAFEIAKFGCTYWSDTEIFDTIKSKVSSSVLFTKANKEAYDHGDNQDKTIKGNKEPCDVKKVPHLLNLAGAIDTDEKTNVFKAFFDLGFARRSFVYVESEKPVFVKMSNAEKRRLTKIVEKNTKNCEKIMKDIFERTKKNMKFENEGNKTFKFSDEAVDRAMMYEEESKEKASKMESSNTSGIVSEIEGRQWRMIKLAPIIAVQESNDFIITEEHIEKAIYLTDFFGHLFGKFYQLENITIEQQVADYIRFHPGTTKTKIRQQKFMPSSQGEQTYLLTAFFDKGGLSELLDETNEILISEKTGAKKNATAYSIIKSPEHDKTPEDQIIRLSVGITKELTETSFKGVDLPFSSLHEITGGKVAYSASVFNSDYRTSKNWTGQQDLLILDIDNTCSEPLTMQEASSRFIGFTHMICTTKSHGIEKHGVVADRFRIILPLVSVSKITIEQFKEVVKRIADQYGLLPALDLPASSDVSRMYQPNPSQSFQYNYGLTMNPLAFLYSSDAGEIKRPINPIQTFKVRGRVVGLDEAIKMAQGKNGTIPCNAFCHDDKTPSAFFCINRDGNFQYTCTVCGISQFKKFIK